MYARFLLTVLLLLVPVSVLASSVAAQGSETVFDEADVLSAAEEQDVRAAFEQVSEESGEQLYAFLVSDTNVDVAERPEFLEEKASEAGAPPDADVIVVDTEDRWVWLTWPGARIKRSTTPWPRTSRTASSRGGLWRGPRSMRTASVSCPSC